MTALPNNQEIMFVYARPSLLQAWTIIQDRMFEVRYDDEFDSESAPITEKGTAATTVPITTFSSPDDVQTFLTEAFEEAVKKRSPFSVSVASISAMRGLAMIHKIFKEYVRGARVLQDAVRLSFLLRNREITVHILSDLATMYLEQTGTKLTKSFTDDDTAKYDMLQETAGITNSVLALQAGNSYECAEELQRQVVSAYKELWGTNTDLTITALGDLASILGDRGKYEAATDMYRQMLKWSEHGLGPEHHTTLQSMSGLALMLSYNGKFQEAEDLNRKVLATSKRVMGLHHSQTMEVMHNLALVLRDEGKFEEAEQLHRELQTSFERTLGKRHPSTLTNLTNLATLLNAQGNHAEAETVGREALELCKNVLGLEHPETVRGMSNLASCYRQMDRLGEAEQLEIQVLEVRRRVLGPEHPETLSSMNNLGVICED